MPRTSVESSSSSTTTSSHALSIIVSLVAGTPSYGLFTCMGRVPARRSEGEIDPTALARRPLHDPPVRHAGVRALPSRIEREALRPDRAAVDRDQLEAVDGPGFAGGGSRVDGEEDGDDGGGGRRYEEGELVIRIHGPGYEALRISSRDERHGGSRCLDVRTYETSGRAVSGNRVGVDRLENVDPNYIQWIGARNEPAAFYS